MAADHRRGRPVRAVLGVVRLACVETVMTARTTARQYSRYLVRVRDLIRKADAEHGHGHGVCRVCGCTQNAACPGGCGWIELDLCSRCV